jgi:hypothetical protein
VSEMPEPSSKPRVAQAANLFDLRRIIGGLFVVYGVLLAVLGLFDSQKEIDKAAGVNINLWAGLGMLAFGLLFITWALTRPLSEELGEDGDRPEPDRPEPDRPERAMAAPPRGVDAAALASHQRGPRPGSDSEGAGGSVDPRPE